LNKQPSIGNVLARTSSSGSTGSHPSSEKSQSQQRQSSQSSLFEQFASQAKELVKETSQEGGLLAHVDKVKFDV
jgi:hypothetical protein